MQQGECTEVERRRNNQADELAEQGSEMHHDGQGLARNAIQRSKLTATMQMMLLRIWEERIEKTEIIKTQKEMDEIQLNQSDVEEDLHQKSVRCTVGEPVQNKE